MGANIVNPKEIETLKAEISLLQEKRKKLFGTVNLKSKEAKLRKEIEDLEAQKELIGLKIKQDFSKKKKELDEILSNTTKVVENKVKYAESRYETLLVEVKALEFNKAKAIKDLDDLKDQYKDYTGRILNEKVCISNAKKKVKAEEKEIALWKHRLETAEECIEKLKANLEEEKRNIKQDRANLELDCLERHKNLAKKEDNIKLLEKHARDNIGEQYMKLDKDKVDFITGRDKYNKRKKNLDALSARLKEKEASIKTAEKELKGKQADLAASWKEFEKAKKRLDWKNRESII